MNPRDIAMLQMLRDARALAYRDAESFDQAVTVLEHIGQTLSGTVGIGLGHYEGAIIGLAGQAPRTDARELRELFRTVREARNDCIHSGDFIRHHVIRLVELLLILEEAISMNGRVASDLMVRNPVTAESWHNVASVRRSMLTNSFSFLPTRGIDGAWKLIADTGLVAYLRPATSTNQRNQRLGRTIQDLLATNEIQLLECEQVPPDHSIDDIRTRIGHRPFLIVDDQNHLHGILTAFDLI